MYYNARYYNPITGRFLSRDSYMGEIGDTLSRSRYAYVKNNPYKYTDPTGHFGIDVSGYIKGKVTSAATDLAVDVAADLAADAIVYAVENPEKVAEVVKKVTASASTFKDKSAEELSLIESLKAKEAAANAQIDKLYLKGVEMEYNALKFSGYNGSFEEWWYIRESLRNTLAGGAYATSNVLDSNYVKYPIQGGMTFVSGNTDLGKLIAEVPTATMHSIGDILNTEVPATRKVDDIALLLLDAQALRGVGVAGTSARSISSVKFTSSSIDHVVIRHFHSSTYINKGKFAKNVNVSKLKEMINKTVKNGTSKLNTSELHGGFIYEFQFDKIIGVNRKGIDSKQLRVVIDRNDTFVTAFPY